MRALRFGLRDGIAVITLERGSVNALSARLRQGLMHALDMARGSAEAVVIRAKGPVFSAGGDINEFDAAPIPPALPEVLSALEDMPIPVIAAINGAAFGGGCELALAAHYRVAGPEARLGLPEVALGLLPGAGGTQRLPRLVGAARALNMILSGQPVGARAALDMGLVDDVVEGDLDTAALFWARQVLEEGLGPRRTRDLTDGLRDGPGFLAEVASRRADAGTPEAALVLDCVEGALLLPFEAGMRRERSVFLELLPTDRARALRHLFRAERAAARLPDGTDPVKLAHVAVLGGGADAMTIAGALLIAGVRVTLLAPDDAAMTDAIGQVLDGFDALVAADQMTVSERDRHLEGLRAVAATQAPVDTQAVLIGAGASDDARAETAALVGTDVPIIHLSNRDSAGVSTARALPYPPVRAGALIELSGPDAAQPTLLALARALKLQPVFATVGGTEGDPIVARLLGAARQAGEACLADGALPEQVDAALRAGGFPAGLFEAEDRTGLTQAREMWLKPGPDRDPSQAGAAITDAMLEAGRTGKDSGAGWYAYDAATNSARPDFGVTQLIEAARPIPARTIPPARISARIFAAMANAGAWMLSDGTVQRAGDIDVAAVFGLGLSRDRGGPMFDADRRGLLHLRAALDDLSSVQPGGWTAAPILDHCIKSGASLLAPDQTDGA